MTEDSQSWIAALTEDQVNQWKKSVEFLNRFFKKTKNREMMHELFESGLVEPLPISFNEFRRKLRLYFTDFIIEILLTSVAQHGIVMLQDFGASQETIEIVGRLARKYSSVLKRAYTSYMMTPLCDWYRIATEITLRDQNIVFLKHVILKHDGTRVEYSGDIPSSFQMTEHIIRQIDRASVVLGKEAVLGTVNSVKLDELLGRLEALVKLRHELDTEIQEMSKEVEQPESGGQEE